MKKLQNSLYLTRDNLYAHKEREAIVVKQENETLLKKTDSSRGGLNKKI